MKKIIAGMILTGLLISGNAFAGEKDKCELISTVSGAIMEVRQRNVPIQEVLNLAKEIETEFGVSYDALHGLIVYAYKQPRYSTEKNQRNAVTDFKNETYITCIK